MIDSKTRLLAVIGYPCRHSLSPLIQNRLIEQYYKNAAYVALEFTPERLKEVYRGMLAMDFIGFNITMPYKGEVYNMADSYSQEARDTGSVNTVKILPGYQTKGFNTDVAGLTQCLDDKKFDWTKSNVLVIGAGGVARSSVYAMLQKQMQNIYIYNRNLSHTKNIRNLYKNDDRITVIKTLNNLNIEDINLVINCTPLGMGAGKNLEHKMPIPDNWNLEGKYIVEMVYQPVSTRLVQKAKREGAVVVGGIEMLISQAAYSFKIWFDLEDVPETGRISKEITKLLPSKET